jgi:hypothetical protein
LNESYKGEGNGEKKTTGNIRRLSYFCANHISMEMKKRNKGLYWLLFLVSTAALLFAIFTHWPWLTLIIPFVTTSFVLAMDII